MILRRVLLLTAVCLSVGGTFASNAFGLGAGDLDPTFSGDGYVLPFAGESYVTAVAPAPGGKVVVAAEISSPGFEGAALARLLPDGSLDPSFGTGGIRTLSGICTSPEGEVNDLTVLPDGRVLTAGGCDDNFLLRRFNADGSDDESFGSGPGGHGAVITHFPYEAAAGRLAVEPGTGAITLNGVCCTGVSPRYQDATLARYTANGQLDPGFDGPPGNPGGGNGKVIISFDNAHDDRGDDMVQLPQGGVAIAGFTNEAALVAEIGTDGNLVKSFSGDGIVTISVPGHRAEAPAIALDGSGNLIVALSGLESISKTEVIRLSPSGDRDKAFGPAVFDGNPGYPTEPVGLEIATDGSILLAAATGVPYPECMCGYDYASTLVARMSPSGQPDPSFGPAGFRRFAGPEGGARPDSFALDASGSLLIGGTSYLFPATGKVEDHGLVTRILAAEPKPVVPSNAFKFGKVKLNKRKGTATLTVIVPDPGSVALLGSKKVRGASRAASAAGTVTLALKLKGKAKKKLARLARKGLKPARVKLKVAVSFTPTGGTAATQTKKLSLVRTAKSGPKPKR